MEITAPTADYYEIGGRKFIRVTRLLHAVGAVDFSKIPDRDRDYYMDRGSAAHDLWQKVEEGIADQYDFDPRVEVYRQAHARFLRETGFRALPGGIELRVKATWRELGLPQDEVGEYAGMAGTLDRLGTIQNRVVLIDYKATMARESTALQTAIYLLMLPGYKFSEVERYGVAFRNDGTYSMSQRYPISDRNEAIYQIHRFAKEAHHVAH